MTEEDQKLVALAALHGAKFERSSTGHGLMWKCVGPSEPRKWTLGRAAEQYLFDNKLRSADEHWDYDIRTDVYDRAQDIDPEFLASVLA